MLFTKLVWKIFHSKLLTKGKKLKRYKKNKNKENINVKYFLKKLLLLSSTEYIINNLFTLNTSKSIYASNLYIDFLWNLNHVSLNTQPQVFGYLLTPNYSIQILKTGINIFPFNISIIDISSTHTNIIFMILFLIFFSLQIFFLRIKF